MESATATATSEALPTTAGRVLVVDDDADIRGLVEFKLQQAGFEVMTADDGAGALSMVENWKPDLVVLDVAMPGLSGYDVCKRFRSDPTMERVPVIMLTARTQATFSTLGYMAGADLYLTKPFSPRELVERVESLLAGGPRPGFGDELLNGVKPEPAGAGEYPAEHRAVGAHRQPRWWRR
jgi:DNA-binding response OmpR family regulator